MLDRSCPVHRSTYDYYRSIEIGCLEIFPRSFLFGRLYTIGSPTQLPVLLGYLAASSRGYSSETYEQVLRSFPFPIAYSFYEMFSGAGNIFRGVRDVDERALGVSAVEGNLLKLRTDGGAGERQRERERERGVPEFRARRLNTAVLHNPDGLTVLSRD